jgi:hypothetical protein
LQALAENIFGRLVNAWSLQGNQRGGIFGAFSIHTG